MKFLLRKIMFLDIEKDEKIKKYLKEWGLENCVDKYFNEFLGG